jgi:hypothetical protein
MKFLATNTEAKHLTSLSVDRLLRKHQKLRLITSTIITAQIKQVTESKMEPIILAALDGEYIIVDRYGDRNGKATTLRKEMIRNFQEQMVYKKTNYDSEKNQFSRNVDEMVNGALSSFKKEFNETVTKEFNKEAINSAVNKISEMLKLPAAIK